jgi:predicted enzyme related to lactoylglutathione lyase
MIYAADVDSLTQFYVQVMGMRVVRSLPDMNIMASSDMQLIIHKSPFDIDVSEPPMERHSAIKLFFTVDDRDGAMACIQALGGQVKPDVWEGPNFLVSNAVDCEGNMFHFRWAKP